MEDKEKTHRNDIYGDIDKKVEDQAPAIPAATVVLLRDGEEGIEVLMLHRTSKVHFGGMWVFPGGRIDDADHTGTENMDQVARNAAARETMEETGVTLRPGDFVFFSHWTPPASTPRRYATWFFVSGLDEHQDINVDGHEIQDHQWIHPAEMLKRHAAGEVDLAPPTWITLYQVSRYSPVSEILSRLGQLPHKVYETRIGRRADGVRVAMWAGDAGYEAGDANVSGERHRLVMAENGFTFENTSQPY
jgi:8-oxo-dGTP pyrophosphatase MutT (NUDIX family)